MKAAKQIEKKKHLQFWNSSFLSKLLAFHFAFAYCMNVLILQAQ